jgi:hypothetical protein
VSENMFRIDVLPFGLFETDHEGKVIHYRPGKKDQPYFVKQSLIGLNLLHDVSDLFCSQEFRSRFDRFRFSGMPADGFSLDVRKNGMGTSVRVLLGKVCRNNQLDRIAKIFIKVSPADNHPSSL